MAREPKKFHFELNEEEADEIRNAKGSGGHQSLHRKLVDALEDGNLSVELNDCELGEIIRYIALYKSGGFQGRLGRAFKRELRNLLLGPLKLN